MAHGTAGYEYLNKSFGVFAKIQPLLNLVGIAVKARFGENIHFLANEGFVSGFMSNANTCRL